MTFEKKILPACPKCGLPALRVLETRKTDASIRRRKECEMCSHLLTTHEVTQEAFQTAQENTTLLRQLRKLLGDEPPLPAVSLCGNCKFNERDRCAFSLPEYQTIDSSDCNLHDPI